MDNFILAYYQAIEDGSAVVGKWIRLFYRYIIEGLQKQSFFFDPKKAAKAIRYIETFCHHSEGRSDTLRLELWQKAFVSVVFGIMDGMGNRQFREVVLIMARKNGKTLFASAIISYCTFLDGEYGAKTFCVAPKLDQADLVYEAFWQSTSNEPELARRIKRRKSDLYVAESNSSIKKIAFNAKKSDGFNPSLTVCDEIASWPGDQGLKQYEVMKSALGARRQPLILSISTAGYVNEGIYDELIKRSTRFLLGDSREKRLAPFLYMMSDVIFQYDHMGRVFARTKNRTLTCSADDAGLKITADLSGTEGGQQLYAEIKGGYTDKMSFGFVVAEDKRESTEDHETGFVTLTRTITKVKKLYDVSAVSLPANDATSISARKLSDGLIEELAAERLLRANTVRRINLKLFGV